MKRILVLALIAHLHFMAYAQNLNDSLFHAIKLNNNELVQLMIQKGADVNYIQQTGYWLKISPLISAVQKKNLEMVKILMFNKADVNWRDGFQTTALLYAAASGQKDMVIFLLDTGADPNITDSNGNTIHSAAQESGNKDLVQYLKTRFKK